MLKDGEETPLLSQVIEDIETYFEGWYNEQKSFAEGLRGKSPHECYSDNLIATRRATKDELDLMLLRSRRTQKVKRNGVSIKIGNTDVWFYDDNLVHDYMGKDVFVRYNLENLKQVHVYDKKERFISFAVLTSQGGYNFNSDADVEAIKENNRRKRQLMKMDYEIFFNELEPDMLTPPWEKCGKEKYCKR